MVMGFVLVLGIAFIALLQAATLLNSQTRRSPDRDSLCQE
jgi:hypothetical protein